MATQNYTRIRVEQDTHGVTIVQFVDTKILEDQAIQQLGRELMELANRGAGVRLVLDFTGVRYLSSAALGKLISLKRRIDQDAGKLRLCEIDPQTMAVFKIAHCDDYFEFIQQRKDAISGLK